mmetsp:Transcript_19648/g.35482  ORF Transcript_19648/g.35482 Transcript_19648/m.35482 type:complete len:242 (+) Transcript_19648:661-1386(+)
MRRKPLARCMWSFQTQKTRSDANWRSFCSRLRRASATALATAMASTWACTTTATATDLATGMGTDTGPMMVAIRTSTAGCTIMARAAECTTASRPTAVVISTRCLASVRSIRSRATTTRWPARAVANSTAAARALTPPWTTPRHTPPARSARPTRRTSSPTTTTTHTITGTKPRITRARTCARARSHCCRSTTRIPFRTALSVASAAARSSTRATLSGRVCFSSSCIARSQMISAHKCARW